MLPENTLPAINRIITNRKDALAFFIDGPMTSADIENLYGLFDAESANLSHIDMIIIFKEYDGIDWKALFNEDTAKIRAAALKKVKRYAIVGGPDWLRFAVDFLRPFRTIDIRWFDYENVDKAWNFINAHSAE